MKETLSRTLPRRVRTTPLKALREPASNHRAARLCLLLVLLATGVFGQWLHYRDPRTPRAKDGKPNLINFDLVNGTYIVPKILDSGYLAIGKKKFTFSRQQ